MLKKNQRNFINILFTLCLIALLYFGFVFYQQTKTLIKSNQLVGQTYQTIELANEVLFKTSLIASKQRGYMMTKNTDFKTVYLYNIRALHLDIFLLKELVKNNPEQQQRVEDLAKSLNEREVFLKEITTTYENQGLQAAIKTLNSNQEIFSFNHMQTLGRQLINAEKKMLAMQTMAVIQASRETMSAALIGEIISIFIIFICFILFNRQLTLRNKAERKLMKLAYYNQLTKLPNRILLIHKLNEEIIKAQKEQYYISILFLNLDNFKNINDSFGFEIGDQVLKLIAKRLKDYVKDKKMVGHLGGDEFIIILQDVFDPLPMIKEVISLINEPIQISNQSIKLSSSIGISLFPTHGADAYTLLKNANIAMSTAKEKGKDNYQFCSPEIIMKVEERALLGYYLQQAIVKDELTVFYQPKISLATDQLAGIEALMRWLRPNGNYVSPENFISLAEDNALILVLGEWMLYAVCKQIKKWQAMGLNIENVAVNISPLQVDKNNFTDKVKKILQETNVDPKIIELEITESILLTDIENNLETLTALKKLGVKITIDDFGTGFSTFGYFKSFSIDKIKIDQSFIKLATFSNRESVIVRSLITMAHDLGFKVVAEGVETADQVEFLKKYQCDEAQGFFYSKAVPPSEVIRFFSKKIE